MNTQEYVGNGLAAVASAENMDALEEARVAYLGRSSELTQQLRRLGSLPEDDRRSLGATLNDVRSTLEQAVEARRLELRDAALAQLDRIDVTLPGKRVPRGYTHLIEETAREILAVLIGLGYEVVDGPEVETVHYNFDALNHSVTHPTRQWTDTFYIDDNTVLRTHTSPMQIRTMERQPPPVYMATAGRCYRRDTPDATHTAMFTQIEGLAIDRGLSLAHLKGTLLAFSREMFGRDREVRLRPHFFPFTEPSVEVDVSCFNCARDGSPCRVCRGEGWVEILGAGMVDPALFDHVEGYDPEELTGYAWGMGVERIAALRHAIPDIRLLWENDLRLAGQFG
jgi:phenylalanyl-tRNA synthetase alpha chain